MQRVIILMTVCVGGFALPVGNPSEAGLVTDGFLWEGHYSNVCDPCASWSDAWSLRTGFYGDYVFNRHMKSKSKGSPHIENTQIFMNAAVITINFWDRLDLFTTVGATRIFASSHVTSFDPQAEGPSQSFEIECSTDFSWSTGIRCTLWECGCTALGSSAQFFSTKDTITRISAGESSTYPHDHFMKHQEFNISCGIAHRINMLIPYGAIQWSHASSTFDNLSHFSVGSVTIQEIHNLKQSKTWGYALGVTLVDCEKAMITAEGRWADQKAFHINGQIRF